MTEYELNRLRAKRASRSKAVSKSAHRIAKHTRILDEEMECGQVADILSELKHSWRKKPSQKLRKVIQDAISSAKVCRREDREVQKRAQDLRSMAKLAGLSGRKPSRKSRR